MATYDFYCTEYGGDSIPEADFRRLMLRAEAQLARYKRIYTVRGDEEAENNAACAMADALYYFETAGSSAQSLSVGSVSCSRPAADLSEKAQARELYRYASLYLEIYRGVSVMLSVRRKDSPIDYALCNQTVTVYHKDGETYTRTVYRNAFLDFKKTQNVDKTGSHEANSFLLVIPGAAVKLYPGDKVLLGEGSMIDTREAWAALIPAAVPGLVIIKYVDPKHWNGVQCHVEAGG